MKREIVLGVFCLFVFSSIASAQDKKFNWVPWAKVSPDIKAKLKKIKGYGDETAYQEIISQLQFGGTASLAVIDLDGDGIAGYAVGFGGSVNGGSSGCSFTVYEQNGKKRIDLTDTWEKIKPAKNGIIASTGKHIALEAVK